MLKTTNFSFDDKVTPGIVGKGVRQGDLCVIPFGTLHLIVALDKQMYDYVSLPFDTSRTWGILEYVAHVAAFRLEDIVNTAKAILEDYDNRSFGKWKADRGPDGADVSVFRGDDWMIPYRDYYCGETCVSVNHKHGPRPGVMGPVKEVHIGCQCLTLRQTITLCKTILRECDGVGWNFPK